jgi:hypothetical protein
VCSSVDDKSIESIRCFEAGPYLYCIPQLGVQRGERWGLNSAAALSVVST